MSDLPWPLHALALRQLASAEQVADILGEISTPAEVNTALSAGVEAGTVMAARGSFMITDAGRAVLDKHYPATFAETRANDELIAAFESFEKINKQVLATMTEWQVIPVGGVDTPNDHSDPDYDAKIISRIGDLHDRNEKVLSPIAAGDPLTAQFLVRLANALTRAEGGEIDYVSGVRVDSYHTIWFQMHEHLLRMFGRQREE